MAIVRPPNWLKQPDALIVAQGIDAQPRLLSNLLDIPCHKYITWSGLQVKGLLRNEIADGRKNFSGQPLTS